MQTLKQIRLFFNPKLSMAIMILHVGGSAQGQTVLLDPGHGGRDPGAISCLGYYEKDVNLAVCRAIRTNLTGCMVNMTRDADVFVSLYDRLNMGNTLNPDLVVSIHCDASENATASGCTAYLYPGACHSSVISAAITLDAVASVGSFSRRMRQARYRVLSGKPPAVLIELGFVSNPGEAARLASPEYQAEMARAIAEAIRQSLRLMQYLR